MYKHINKRSLIIIFYFLFVLFGSLSLIFIPNALSYRGGSEVALFFIFLPLAYVLWDRFGVQLFLKLTITLSLFALFIEYIGLITGWPYGEFVYTGELGYRIAGILPWTVGLSWTPLVIGSVALVYLTTQKKVLRIVMPALVLVSFDLLLDPSAVSLGLWSYMDGGSYYNVPISNFLGWMFSGLIGSSICFYFLNKYPERDIKSLIYSFFLSIVFWSVVSLGLGLWVPFFFGVCLIVYSAVVHYKSNEKIS